MSKPPITPAQSQALRRAARSFFASSDSKEVRSVLISLFLKAKFRWSYDDLEDLQEDLERRGFEIKRDRPGFIAFTQKYGGYEVFPVATAWKSIAAILRGQRDLKDPRENEQYNDDDIPFY